MKFLENFWLSVTIWLNATNIIFGFFGEDYLLLNHIIIICKKVIFQCRNRNIKPSLSLLKGKLKYVYQLECSITKQKDSLETHQKKWKELLPILNCKKLYLQFCHFFAHIFVIYSNQSCCFSFFFPFLSFSFLSIFLYCRCMHFLRLCQ